MACVPLHPLNKRLQSKVGRLIEIAEELKALQLERKMILASMPLGYFMYEDDRFVVREQSSSRVSIRMLRKYVTDDIIKCCTVRGNINRSMVAAPLKPAKPPKNQEQM